MSLIYYKSKKGNFGDDLNPWLWPKIFKPFRENVAFLGIGSILHQENALIKQIDPSAQKVVFGTGIRPTNSVFQIDDTWDVRFLRGPLSTRMLGNKHKYISDAAYALCCLDQYKGLVTNEKKYNVSLMPYYKSCDFFDWSNICKDMGIHYISPLSENGVEHTLNEIASSKVLITEAMHGAILSDALRVPWHRFILSTPHVEGSGVSEFKWMDWLFSIDLNTIKRTNFEMYSRKNFVNKVFNRLGMDNLRLESYDTRQVVERISKKVPSIKDFYLSNDNKMAEIKERFELEITAVGNLYT